MVKHGRSWEGRARGPSTTSSSASRRTHKYDGHAQHEHIACEHVAGGRGQRVVIARFGEYSPGGEARELCLDAAARAGPPSTRRTMAARAGREYEGAIMESAARARDIGGDKKHLCRNVVGRFDAGDLNADRQREGAARTWLTQAKKCHGRQAATISRIKAEGCGWVWKFWPACGIARGNAMQHLNTTTRRIIIYHVGL